MSVIGQSGRLFASALMLCVSGVASAEESKTPIEDALKQLQAQIDALNAKKPTTVTSNTLVIESWLLSSQAIERTAEKISAAVTGEVGNKPDRDILVLAGPEAFDFGQVAIVRLEIETLARRFRQLIARPSPSLEFAGSLPAIAGALLGLLKTETQLEALEQNIDASLIAAAVAERIPRGKLASAVAVTAGNAPILQSFTALMDAADEANRKATKEQADELKKLNDRFDALSSRLLTAKDGAVPLATVARMDVLISSNPYILSIKTEKSGGTLLKRTNLVTALGGETAFVSGGLVSSYRLSDPNDGRVLEAGVTVCRTALTSLKRVQNGLWQSGRNPIERAICLP